MPNLYVKDAGVWKPVKRIWVRDGGVWKSPSSAFVRQGGTFSRYYPDNVTPTTYSTPGTYNYTVPNGVTSVNVSYITTSGTTSTSRSVTPGEVVTVTIGNYGSGSSFGAFSAPAFSLNVCEISTRVDQSPGLGIDQAVATSSPITFTGSGTQDILEPAAQSSGIYYDEYTEGNQGDWNANVTLRTTATSYLVNPYQVAVTAFNGRGSNQIVQQPSAGNSYRYRILIFDSSAGSADYSWTVTLQQIVALTIS